MPRSPKSDGVATIGLPKWCCQIRLTITRAARARGGPLVSQRASWSRPLASLGIAREGFGSRQPAPRAGRPRRGRAGRRLSGASRRSAGPRGRHRPRSPASGDLLLLAGQVSADLPSSQLGRELVFAVSASGRVSGLQPWQTRLGVPLFALRAALRLGRPLLGTRAARSRSGDIFNSSAPPGNGYFVLAKKP